MSEIKDGGPAFPISSPSGTPEYMPMRDGMTLRDYFAAACIPEMIRLSMDQDGGWLTENVANGCYNLADAMLKAREIKP